MRGGGGLFQIFVNSFQNDIIDVLGLKLNKDPGTLTKLVLQAKF